ARHQRRSHPRDGGVRAAQEASGNDHAVVEVLKLRISLFDLRLGVRMLARYPVLTLVGTASLAFAIAIGAAAFAFISLMLWPSLPLPEGDRVVSVRLPDEATNEDEDRKTRVFLCE